MPTPLREPPAPPARPRNARLAALFERKLTPGIALLFFLALAAMCAAAAGIGWVSQQMRHVEVRK